MILVHAVAVNSGEPRMPTKGTRMTSQTAQLARLTTRAILSVAAVGALLTPAALMPAIGAATPPIGTTGATTSKQTVDGKDYIINVITIGPGAGTHTRARRTAW